MIKINWIKGFTLLELIIVIAIIGILATVLIPQFIGFQEKARAVQSTVDARQVATAADAFIIESNIPNGELLDKGKVANIAGVNSSSIISDIENEAGIATFTYRIIKGDKTYTTTRDNEGSLQTKISNTL